MTNVERCTEGTNTALPSLYQRQKTADEGVNHIVSRVLPHIQPAGEDGCVPCRVYSKFIYKH